jgi:ABC-type multidrug transport system fused ATPase/permease subunit
MDATRLGDVLARLTGDVGAIETFVLSGVADALTYTLRIVFFTGALFYLQWRLALVSLVVVPLFWLAARHFSRRMKAAARERLRRSGSISAVAEESFANAALVQAYNRQRTETERFHRQTLGSFAAHLASARAKALLSPIVDLIEVVGALVVIALGTWTLAEGQLSLGGLLVFLTYLGQLYGPVRGLAKLGTSIYAASAAAERVVECLDERPSVREAPRARSLGRARGVVELDRVSFRYPGTARDALADVSFRVGPGETLALVGPSGAGKSTIAKLLLRFYDPTAGAVRLDGHDLRELRLESLRDNVAVLLQEALVFDASVRENIAYGRPDATDDDVVCAARAADAHEFITALPGGYDAAVGQKGRRLSGGQRQRIAIARAMIREAPVLVLDEPTTGLDVESGRRLMEPLRRLMRGRATIIISHNLALAREATSVLVLQEGRVIERGTHATLVARGGAYAALYRLHQGEDALGHRPPSAAAADDADARAAVPS